MTLEYGVPPKTHLCLDDATLYTWTCTQQNKYDWHAYYVNPIDRRGVIFYQVILVRDNDD
jgi:hypothetical protein